MKKYKVIKAFFKLSDKKNYAIGDTIELSEKDAKAMDWYVVENKEEAMEETDSYYWSESDEEEKPINKSTKKTTKTKK